MIVNPLNAFVFGDILAKLPQGSRRLHRDQVPTALCQRRGISTASGADVQSKAVFLFQQRQPVAVYLIKNQELVLIEELLGLLIAESVRHATASFAACCHMKFGIGVRSFQVILMGGEPVWDT